MTARVFLPLVLALGLVLGWALWVRAPASAERDAGAAVEGAASSRASGSFQEEVLARLARMEAELAQLTGGSLAAAPAPSPLAAPSPSEARRAAEASLPSAPAVDLAPLEAEIAALARAVEALQQVVRSSETSAKFPSLESLRSASEPNWDQIDVLVELDASRREDELQALLHWMSQEEVLAKYGRPDMIDHTGQWYYLGEKTGHKSTMILQFISNYVLRVSI